MNGRIHLFLATASLLLLATTPFARGQSSDNTPSVADTWWEYHGNVEVGGRFFANNPKKDGIASQGDKSLSKYYEYSTIKPGAFANAWLNAGSKDGVWDVNLWSDNIGYSDQRYQINASKAGEYYLDFGWDQTPHIYSTNARTIFNGVGTTSLTAPAGLGNNIYNAIGAPGYWPCVATSTTPGNACNTGAGQPYLGKTAISTGQRTAIQQQLDAVSHQTDIGIRRDTASVAFRWTPNDAWDINVDYSNMHRFGTQVDGVVFSPGTSGAMAQVPKPVDDTTQNFGLNGEYKGTSPWGQNFTVKLGYGGSVYTDANSSYTVQNPFCETVDAAGCARWGSPSYPLAQMSLWPNNQANGFTSTVGADLPMKSRYMGTLAYTMMRQNQAFLPFSPNATVFNSTTPGAPTTTAVPGLPASSLNGSIDTFLSNNVLTTQITPTLKSKLSYRYYNFDNRTPELNFNDWVVADSQLASVTSASYAPVRSISVSYTKQNAGGDIVWAPDRHWNLGAGYGYERYNWTRADANITNENSGKAFVDWKPWIWLTSRASATFADRHYQNYDYLNYVGIFQWPTAGNTRSSTAMRQFYLDNRERSGAKYSLAIDLIRGLTITPTFAYQDDDYSISATEVGLVRSQAIKTGVELAYAVAPGTTFLFSYMNEQYRQNMKYSTATGTSALTAANTYHADVRDSVNTFMGAVNWAAIPDKLDVKLSYALSLSKDSQPQYSDTGAAPAPQYPDVTGRWQRLEAQVKYTFDKETVRQLGVHGEAYAKLRYVWERNSVDNYDQDIMQTYMGLSVVGASTSYMTWLAYDNPNYDVHLIGASVGLKW